jgi:hypothetical protein
MSLQLVLDSSKSKSRMAATQHCQQPAAQQQSAVLCWTLC